MKTGSSDTDIRSNMIIRFTADDLSTDRIVTYLGGLVFYTAPKNNALPTTVNISVRRVTKLEDGVIKCELDDSLNDLQSAVLESVTFHTQSVVLERFTFRTQVDVKYQLIEAHYEDGTLKGTVDVSKAEQTGETKIWCVRFCQHCSGTGKIMKTDTGYEMEGKCLYCNGTGRITGCPEIKSTSLPPDRMHVPFVYEEKDHKTETRKVDDHDGETTSDEKLQKWGEQRERQHLLSSSKLGISFIVYVEYNQTTTSIAYLESNVIGLVFEQDGKDNYVALRSFTRCDSDSVFRAAPYDSPNLEPFLDFCKTKKFPMKLTGLVFWNNNADKWDPEFHYKLTRADIVYVDFSTPYAGGYQTDRISLDVAPAVKGKHGHEEHQALFGCLVEDLDKKMRIMFLVEDKSTDSPDTIDVRQKEISGDLITSYWIEPEGQTERYEVRGVSVSEFTGGGHVLLQSKRCDYIKGLDVELVKASSNIWGEPAQPRKVCSDLVVKQGVTVSDVEIFHGGSVTVEEGGTIRDVKVYPGGELEFCKGAKAIDVYALGGHIYGDDLKCKYASVVLSGVELDTSASFEEGSYIKGLITSGYLAVGAGAHLKDVNVKKGGYVSLFGRSTVEGLSVDTNATVTLFPDCTVHHLVAEVGSTVRIFSGARIFKGDIKGIVDMDVPKEEDLKHDSHLVDVTFSEAVWYEQMESLGDEEDDDE